MGPRAQGQNAGQARVGAKALRMVRRAVGPALLLGAAGCADVPKDFQPSYWWRNLSGAYLDERQSPPGLDAPYPHLGQVPGDVPLHPVVEGDDMRPVAVGWLRGQCLCISWKPRSGFGTTNAKRLEER